MSCSLYKVPKLLLTIKNIMPTPREIEALTDEIEERKLEKERLREERKELKRKKQRAPTTRFEAALLMPLTQPVTSGFAGDALPDDVIELRMPPTGSVSLRTVDRDGRPFTHPVHGELRMAFVMGVPSCLPQHARQ